MRRLVRVLSLLLLALWLPATLHCALEASEVLTESHESSDGCCASDTTCAVDSCDTVENGEYLLSSGTSLPRPCNPETDAVPCDDEAASANASADPADAASLPEPEPAADWLPTWHFSRRSITGAQAP